MKTTKRVFVAVDISAEAKARVVNLTSEMRREFPDLRVGWEKPEKLHLTIKFLGDIEHDHLDSLQKAVDETAKLLSPFLLELQGTGCFPSPKKAKILWTGIHDPANGLRNLYETLEETAAGYGFTKESRSFKPHLTIARLREPEKAGRLTEKFLQAELEPVSFEVSNIVIYESKLQPTGSVYSVISKHQLLLLG